MTQPDPATPTPPAPAPTPTPPATPPAQTPPSGYVSQDEVNRIAAREKDEGKRAAEKAIADQLGVDLETAKGILKAHREQEEQSKSDAQKAREQADREKAEAEAVKQAAAAETHTARLARAFATVGVIDDAKISKYGRLVDAEVGASYEDVKKAVDKLKTEEPGLFGATTPTPGTSSRPAAPNSDPAGTPPRAQPSNDAMQRGMERAKNFGKGFGWTQEQTSA